MDRFISPDPFVQDPEDPQNLNRYSYVLNNPQSYIDPSGYFVEWLLGGAAAGVEVLELVKYATAVTVGSGAGGAAVSGAGWFSAGGWSLFGQGLQTLGVGAAAAWPAIQIGLGTVGTVAAAGAVGTACAATAGLACGAAAVGFAASVDQLGTGIHGLLTGLEQPSGLERVFGAFGASPEGAAFSAATIGAIVAPSRGLGHQNFLYKAAVQPFKSSNLSSAGRALTKHPELVGETKETLRQSLRTDAAINQAAHSALRNIMRNGITTNPKLGRYGTVTQIQIPGGFGARWAEDGSFIGFINP